MKHTFQESREIDETLISACQAADQWVCKTKSMSKDEWRTARAYLRAKQNYLDKVDTIIDLLTGRGDDQNDQVDE
jgi:hypothetical protein